ncbi:hypothetical protein AV545_03685 [Paenibacillus jamilae]|uniref:hypothetical protein n=1 Tax=Paenibacillus jamilae TaxID=114136 RepID=UPI0007ABAEEB|nr:hypothetical protein [Paenibacillus jamilae]KZE65033.1 hypothetical protein AV545_03685 [Paenibacillus jamilae]
MGLTVSHGAFDAAYSAFNRFRAFLLESIGGSFPPHDNEELKDNYWYYGDGYSTETHKGLTEFFGHSDCDGYIDPDMCLLVADELECILPNIIRLEKEKGKGQGHVLSQGGYVQLTKYFIQGCRLAAKRNENLEFR